MARRDTCAAETPQIALQDAMDASDMIGRWEWDIPNDRLFADATVALLSSVDPSVARGGAPLSLFLKAVHPEDRVKTAEIIARSALSGRSYVHEYRIHSADGALRWVLARGRIELDETGQPRRGSGFLIDVTENHADEAACSAGLPDLSEHPLEEAAEHCLAARQAVQKLADPLLENMTNMLLLELGRRLSKLERDQRRARMN
ncbi:PAS domain-containing protein [Methylobacterium sp. 37f]|uniref:PAS domain-containing protein n=1 Tax=Methylobacterium sp. 37f TaxID=2817058 RepID=UPI001FFC7283|nr:PAS domain-containing protein [Methylobacterium sp. 37f]MCK2056297.1 PAS domain-containing protein [Methylobacterium sp. 37f]